MKHGNFSDINLPIDASNKWDMCVRFFIGKILTYLLNRSIES